MELCTSLWIPNRKASQQGHASPLGHYRRQTKGRMKASTSGHVPKKPRFLVLLSLVFFFAIVLDVRFPSGLPSWLCLCLGFLGLWALLLLRTPSRFIIALLFGCSPFLFYKCGEQTPEQGIKLASNPAADTKNQRCVWAFMRVCACICCVLAFISKNWFECQLLHRSTRTLSILLDG
jgi:hypothetical protein